MVGRKLHSPCAIEISPYFLVFALGTEVSLCKHFYSKHLRFNTSSGSVLTVSLLDISVSDLLMFCLHSERTCFKKTQTNRWEVIVPDLLAEPWKNSARLGQKNFKD